MTVWDALGGRRSTDAIARQISSGAAPHAWLLLGPSGSGKRAVATAIAAALNCEVRPRVGCGTCSACARIARHRHPDVHHIAPEGPLIPVDVIRDAIVPEAARSPFEGTTKVFVVEEADRMNQAAQNALLKTLEEPQPDTVFVLISEHEDELLETIRSRCSIVRLEPLERAEIEAILVAEGASAEEAAFAARLCDGDLERARALASDPGARERRTVWATIPARLGSPVAALDAAAEVIDVARAVVKDLEAAQKKEVEALAEAIGEGRGTGTARQALATRHKRELRRAEQAVLLEALQVVASFYRDVVAFRAGAGDVVNVDLSERIEAWATSGVSSAALLEAVDACAETQAALPLNANPALAIEGALVRIARLAPPPVTVSSA